MNRIRFQISNQKGTVLILSSVALLSMFMMLSLTLDAGYIFVTRGKLQNAADAAALAAVTHLPVSREEALRMSLNFAQAHKAGSAVVNIPEENVILGHYDFGANVFYPDELPINAAKTIPVRNANALAGELTLFFAKILGIPEVALEKRAMAAADPRVVGIQAGHYLVPYTIHQSIVDQDGDGNFDIGRTIDIHPGHYAPGNFGFLDLDADEKESTAQEADATFQSETSAAQSTFQLTSEGIPEIRQYLFEGFDKDFSIPESGFVDQYGTTGVKGNSLLSEFEKIEGRISYFPVHIRVAEQGDNALFTVVMLVGMRIKNVKLTGSLNTRHIQAEIVQSASSAFMVRENAAENNSLQKIRLIE